MIDTQAPARFVARPYAVAAVRFDGGNLGEVAELVGPMAARMEPTPGDERLLVVSECDTVCCEVYAGEWVVLAGGRAFRLPDDEFAARYAPAESPPEG